MKSIKSKKKGDQEIRHNCFSVKGFKEKQVEIQIETLLNNQNDIKNSTFFLNSGASAALLQTKVDMNTNISSLNRNSNNNLFLDKNIKSNINSKKNSENNVSNINDLQFCERDITAEEENKIKNAFSKHFIFQDLNDEFM